MKDIKELAKIIRDLAHSNNFHIALVLYDQESRSTITHICDEVEPYAICAILDAIMRNHLQDQQN